MIRKAIAPAAVALALFGCVAQQQREAVQQTASCLQTAYDSPEAVLIRPRTPFNVNDASLAQLADTSIASKPEMDAISAVYPHVQACQHQFLQRLAELAPAFVPVFAKNNRDGDDDAIALLQSKMTWGEFNRRRRDRAITGQQTIIEEERRLVTEDQARANAMIQGLAAAYAITQAAQPVQPRATFTTCTQQGAFTNCIQR